MLISVLRALPETVMTGSNSPYYLTGLYFDINLDEGSHLQKVTAGLLKGKFLQLQTHLAYVSIKVFGTKQF